MRRASANLALVRYAAQLVPPIRLPGTAPVVFPIFRLVSAHRDELPTLRSRRTHGREGDGGDAKKQQRKHDHNVVKAFTRELLNVAESDIKLADFIVRNNRTEGEPDDPESTRKLRLSFRRVQYRLSTMASIDPTLGADDLIERLYNVGKPFGRLRDAEVLEAGVIQSARGTASPRPKVVSSWTWPRGDGATCNRRPTSS